MIKFEDRPVQTETKSMNKLYSKIFILRYKGDCILRIVELIH